MACCYHMACDEESTTDLACHSDETRLIDEW